jgi:hypothetical protein
MDMPGRNDPCPCGSGLKYKRCHGASSAVGISGNARGTDRSRAVQALDERLAERLLRFERLRYGKPWFQAMLRTYTERGASTLIDVEEQLALPWAFFSYRERPEDECLAELFRQDQGRRLDRDMRDLLDAQLGAWLSLWIVDAVDPGVGMTLRDLLSHETRYVHERLASASLRPGHVTLARVVDADGISFLAGLHPQGATEEGTYDLLLRARRHCRVRTRAVSPDVLRSPEIARWLIGEWRALAEVISRPPTLQNTDGDPIEPTVDHFTFAVANRDDVVRGLSGMDGADEPEESDEGVEIAISRPAAGSRSSTARTLIGRLLVGAGRLRLETNSIRRADLLRQAVLRATKPLVQHRLREETNIARLLEGPAAERDASGGSRALPPRPEMTPEQQGIVRSMKERHYAQWLDDSIPALGGATPREAVRTKGGRERVAVLLRQLERGEAMLPEAERFDVRGLRKALGLE